VGGDSFSALFSFRASSAFHLDVLCRGLFGVRKIAGRGSLIFSQRIRLSCRHKDEAPQRGLKVLHRDIPKDLEILEFPGRAPRGAMLLT
jgi:hypothetical protein